MVEIFNCHIGHLLVLLLLLSHRAVHMLIVMHEVLVVLGLVLMLGMEVVVEITCCPLGTQSLFICLVAPDSLLPPPWVDPWLLSPSPWLLYCRTVARAH